MTPLSVGHVRATVLGVPLSEAALREWRRVPRWRCAVKTFNASRGHRAPSPMAVRSALDASSRAIATLYADTAVQPTLPGKGARQMPLSRLARSPSNEPWPAVSP